MLRLDVMLTNRECQALAPMLQQVRDAYAERMSVSELPANDLTTEAYAAWVRIMQPVIRHLKALSDG